MLRTITRTPYSPTYSFKQLQRPFTLIQFQFILRCYHQLTIALHKTRPSAKIDVKQMSKQSIYSEVYSSARILSSSNLSLPQNTSGNIDSEAQSRMNAWTQDKVDDYFANHTSGIINQTFFEILKYAGSTEPDHYSGVLMRFHMPKVINILKSSSDMMTLRDWLDVLYFVATLNLKSGVDISDSNILIAMVSKGISKSTASFQINNVFECLFSLRNMHSRRPQVLQLIECLTPKIEECEEKLPTGKFSVVASLGLLSTDEPAVRNLIRVVTPYLTMFNTTGGKVHPEMAAVEVNGMQNMNSKYEEVQLLCKELATLIRNTTGVWPSDNLSYALKGFQNLDPNHSPDVEDLFLAILEKIYRSSQPWPHMHVFQLAVAMQNVNLVQRSNGEFLSLRFSNFYQLLLNKLKRLQSNSIHHFMPWQICMILHCLGGLSPKFGSFKPLYREITRHVYSSKGWWTPYTVVKAMYCFRNHFAYLKEADVLLSACVDKFSTCKENMTSSELVEIFGNLKGFVETSNFDTLAEFLVTKVRKMNGKFSPNDFCRNLFGISNLHLERETSRQLLRAILLKTETDITFSTLTIEDISKATRCIFNFDPTVAETVDTIKLLQSYQLMHSNLPTFDILQCNFKNLSGILFGYIPHATMITETYMTHLEIWIPKLSSRLNDISHASNDEIVSAIELAETLNFHAHLPSSPIQRSKLYQQLTTQLELFIKEPKTDVSLKQFYSKKNYSIQNNAIDILIGNLRKDPIYAHSVIQERAMLFGIRADVVASIRVPDVNGKISTVIHNHEVSNRIHSSSSKARFQTMRDEYLKQVHNVQVIRHYYEEFPSNSVPNETSRYF